MRLTIGIITLVPFGTTKESPGIFHSLVQVLPVKATGASLRPSFITLTLNFMRPLSDLTLSVVGGLQSPPEGKMQLRPLNQVILS